MKKWCGILRNWVFLCRFSWGISRRIWVSYGLSAVLDAVEPFAVLIMPKFVIDELTGAKRWDIVLLFIAIFIGVLALLKLVRLGIQVFVNMAVNQCDVQNAGHYANLYLNMDYSRLEDGRVRDFQGRIVGDVHAGIIAEKFGNTAVCLIRLAGYAYLICSLHFLVLAAVSAVAAANCVLGMRREKNRYAVQPELAAHNRKLDYLFNTMGDFGFAKEVRINQVSRWLSEKFDTLLESYGKTYRGYRNRQLLLHSAEKGIGFLQMGFLYGYAAYRAVAGQITVGDFSVYAGAVLNFSGTFSEFADGLTQMVYLSKYANDYIEYADLARPTHLDKGRVPLSGEEQNHVIEFKDVSFRYPNTDHMALKHISLTIRSGEKLSVVGINGAGKTTFIKLLCRLYEPTEGVILYNGTDISTIRYEDYVRLLAVVFQDFRLFAFSMEDNIVLNGVLDRKRLEDAVDKSGLREKVKSLSEGLDTPVSREFEENGVEFSGGEGQKLVTARAYYKDAPVVILDEPTAALDPVSEHQMYRRFEEIVQDKTAIFISHRLSSSRFCDRIAVFAQGQIAEYGTHEELMDRKGLYREMFQRQAEYYKDQDNNEATEEKDKAEREEKQV